MSLILIIVCMILVYSYSGLKDAKLKNKQLEKELVEMYHNWKLTQRYYEQIVQTTQDNCIKILNKHGIILGDFINLDDAKKEIDSLLNDIEKN